MAANKLSKIEHLPAIQSRHAELDSINIHFLDTEQVGTPVLFLHGNASSSTFWEEVMVELPLGYRGIAPDLRGYGQTTRTALIDATRGVGNWVDDFYNFLSNLGIERFHLVGHSMGGMISWGILADPRFGKRIQTATLVAPGPPCGFGGLHGKEGHPNNPDFSGSGAGLVHPRFAELIVRGERGTEDPVFSPRTIMNRLFWKPPFRPAREEAFLSAVLQVHCGEKQFPGDVVKSNYWPGFAPGSHGPANAMSGRYNSTLRNRLLEQEYKPPLLVIMGEDDPIICNQSAGDAAVLGKLGVLPGWPGEDLFPPQPFQSQVKAAAEGYLATGGKVIWSLLPDCGHTPYLEKADTFRRELHDFLTMTTSS